MTGNFRRALVLAVLGLAAMIAATVPASASCASLERQLAALPATHSYGKAADTARRQREALGEARRQARVSACDKDRGSRQCRMLKPLIAKMEVRLAQLETRAGGNGPRGAARIRAKMIAAGCTRGAAHLRKGQTTAPVNRLRSRPKTKGLARAARPAPPKVAVAAETFRTLCVRECDGYFFPISFSTTADRFKKDADACTAQCPGTAVSLYAHPMPNADVDTMVSALDGTPYADLKTAFLYKLGGPARTKACGCGVPKAIRAAIAAAKEPAVQPARRPVAIPTPRPDLIAELQLTRGLRGTFSSGAAGGLEEVAKDPVRVVGPSFFPE